MQLNNNIVFAGVDVVAFAKYRQMANKIDILTHEEEIELFTQFSTGNVEVAKRIVEAHLKLVTKVVSQYATFGVPLMDLVSEGVLGLCVAVKKFNLSMGCRFSTYAIWFVKANVKNALMRMWSIVKFGTNKEERSMFFNLSKAKSHLGISGTINTQNAQSIAELLGSTAKNVLQVEQRLTKRESPLELNDGSCILPASTKTPEELAEEQNTAQQRKRILFLALNTIPKRDREILLARFSGGDKQTLEKIGKKFGISQERVRQIISSSTQKVKKFLITNHKNELLCG